MIFGILYRNFITQPALLLTHIFCCVSLHYNIYGWEKISLFLFFFHHQHHPFMSRSGKKKVFSFIFQCGEAKKMYSFSSMITTTEKTKWFLGGFNASNGTTRRVKWVWIYFYILLVLHKYTMYLSMQIFCDMKREWER